MHSKVISFAVLLCSSLITAEKSPECIWSFDINTHQVQSRFSRSSTLTDRFPRKFLIADSTVFFFDSHGMFKRSISVANNQRIRVSERGEVIFVRDDIPITHEGIVGPVRVLSGDGEILCESSFNYMLLEHLIELDAGRSYFTGRDPFHYSGFYDSNLVYIRNSRNYCIVDYCYVEGANRIILLTSDSRGPVPEFCALSLTCVDRRGKTLWDKPLGSVRAKSCLIQADIDDVILCYEGEASRARMIIYDSCGDIVHSVILPHEPKAMSNILDNQFILLEETNEGFCVYSFSARTGKSRTFRLLSRHSAYGRAQYSVLLLRDKRLLISSQAMDTWEYMYFKGHNKLLHSIAVTQESKPIIVLDRDRMFVLELEKGSICLSRR